MLAILVLCSVAIIAAAILAAGHCPDSARGPRIGQVLVIAGCR